MATENSAIRKNPYAVSNLAPLLTEKDPAESSEGGINPLGTEALADALAVRLVPGVRERQQHPRFLTALAVSLEVCRDFNEETLASDGVSEPWQVFEWYLVEGLVRTAESGERVGLPGSQKATKAITDGVPLSAKRYLKSPTVFGFHGVYRQLARALGIETDGRLGEAGFDLLNIWAKEQGLEGFAGTGGGEGLAVRNKLREAVQAGLESHATDRNGNWFGWSFFRDHLAPYAAGRKERHAISAMLLNDAKGFRRDVIESLISDAGRQAWKANNSEREFHAALHATACDELLVLLDAIDAYERFSRLCHDAFLDCLCEMTRQGGKKTSPAALAVLPSVKTASRRVPEMFSQIMERLEPVGEAARFRETFAGLAERGAAVGWVERLMEHHRKTQKQKPPKPNGKYPWFERFDDGSVIIRPHPRTEEPGAGDERYAHLYRSRSLWQFALDLKLVKP